MQTTTKTTETASGHRADHEAGVNGISAMPPVQRMSESETSAVAESNTETATTPNHTGLPDTMKTNLENASGFDMSDVRVHRNDPGPAKVGALAYTQGTDIYLGPGQEQHLGHEAWHSAQYKQGRVRANTSFKSADGGEVAGNDQAHLEREADVMGAKISQYVDHSPAMALAGGEQHAQPTLQKKSARSRPAIQRKIGFEFQTVGIDSGRCYKKSRSSDSDYNEGAGSALVSKTMTPNINDMQNISREHDPFIVGVGMPDSDKVLFKGNGWKLINDGNDLEFVTEAFNERSRRGRRQARNVMVDMMRTIESWRTSQPENQAWFRPKTTVYDVRAKIPDGMHAHPQTTMGIPLDAMDDFLTRVIPTPVLGLAGGEFGWSDAPGKVLQKDKSAEVRFFIDGLNNSSLHPVLSASPGLRGVIAFAVSSMASFRATNAGLWKDRLAFMHRTGFSDMVGTLSTAERIQLQTLVATPTSELWRKLAWSTDITPATQLQQATDTTPLTAQDFMDAVARGGDPVIEWIRAENHDPTEDFPQLAALRGNRPGSAADRAKYGMTRPTDIGHGAREGMVMELRALPRHIPYTEWPDFALRILQIYAEITR